MAEFDAEMPPGRYIVGVSARDRDGHRGVKREEVTLEPNSVTLAASDVVVTCGALPPSLAGTTAVRLEPNPAARVADGEALTAYFEIYHLVLGIDDLSHFEFTVTVRSAERDPRVWIQRLFAPRQQIPSISVSREDANSGRLRRQFVSVPVQPLPPGKFVLEVRVRDTVAGSETTRLAPFVKAGATTGLTEGGK